MKDGCNGVCDARYKNAMIIVPPRAIKKTFSLPTTTIPKIKEKKRKEKKEISDFPKITPIDLLKQWLKIIPKRPPTP